MPLDKPPLAAIPPLSLIGRVTGKEDVEWFKHSGGLTMNDWANAMNATGRNFDHFSRIVDFGCGCGRVARHLRANLKEWQELIGVDVDAEAIGWVNENLEGVQAFHLGEDARIPLGNATVDLIVNHSVFTHLPEDLQFHWLEELRRVLAPTGLAVLTFHGRKVWTDFENAMIELGRAAELPYLRARFERTGFYYQPQRTSWEMALPEYYGATFHTIRYVEEEWLTGFKLKAWLPVASLAHQDIVVLERL